MASFSILDAITIWRHSSGRDSLTPLTIRATVVVVIAAIESDSPPYHLLLGNAAFEGAMAKLDELRKDFVAGKSVARGADFPKQKLGLAA